MQRQCAGDSTLDPEQHEVISDRYVMRQLPIIRLDDTVSRLHNYIIKNPTLLATELANQLSLSLTIADFRFVLNTCIE